MQWKKIFSMLLIRIGPKVWFAIDNLIKNLVIWIQSMPVVNYKKLTWITCSFIVNKIDTFERISDCVQLYFVTQKRVIFHCLGRITLKENPIHLVYFSKFLLIFFPFYRNFLMHFEFHHLAKLTLRSVSPPRGAGWFSDKGCKVWLQLTQFVKMNCQIRPRMNRSYQVLLTHLHYTPDTSMGKIQPLSPSGCLSEEKNMLCTDFVEWMSRHLVFYPL